MTTMKKAETKPFWMDDEEWERRYPQMPQVNIADSVVSSVPELTEVEKGNIVGAYTFKDGLLLYHFYKKDRKEIYDAAQNAMDRVCATTEDCAEQSRLNDEIAREANKSLEKHPWWENFKDELHSVFSETFKYQEHKVSFYKEVDSWSVMLPEPVGVTRPSKQHLEKPFATLALRFGG